MFIVRTNGEIIRLSTTEFRDDFRYMLEDNKGLSPPDDFNLHG